MFGLRDSIPDELKRRLIIKVSRTKTDNLVDEALSQAALQPQYGEPWITYQTSVDCCNGFEETFEKAAKQKYKKADKQIYHKLCQYGDEVKAIRIAENKLKQYSQNEMDKTSEMCPATTVHMLVKEIKSKIEK